MPCSCCYWWINSPITSRGGSANGRKCIAAKKNVFADSEECKYFNPTMFHCDNFGCRLTFGQCISRRRNEKRLNSWEACKKCRQFDKEIRPIIEKYFLDMVPIVTPRPLVEKEKPAEKGKRVIKRRSKKEKGKRVIKRREKKKERKIRRRK